MSLRSGRTGDSSSRDRLRALEPVEEYEEKGERSSSDIISGGISNVSPDPDGEDIDDSKSSKSHTEPVRDPNPPSVAAVDHV